MEHKSDAELISILGKRIEFYEYKIQEGQEAIEKLSKEINEWKAKLKASEKLFDTLDLYCTHKYDNGESAIEDGICLICDNIF